MRINVERSTADTKERSPVQSPCRVVTSVTHDGPSRSPSRTKGPYTRGVFWRYSGLMSPESELKNSRTRVKTKSLHAGMKQSEFP